MFARRIIIGAVGLVAAVGAASPAVASQGVGFTGSFDGRTYNGCVKDGAVVTPPVGVVTGSWRVNLHDAKATARFVIDVNAAPHVAYSAQLERVADEAAVFRATTTTGAGPLEVTLVGTDFTYTIAPYTDPFGGGFVCDAVVYTGRAG
jgi:hypothetical protein